MKVPEHEHPLTLIDLQVQYEEEEEDEEDDDDEGGDTIKKEEFSQVACGKCSQVISMYHRYYYKCMECDFSLHKFCGELPERLDHTLHPHPLFQHWRKYGWTCCVCEQQHTGHEMLYDCSKCYFCIDINCAIEVGKEIIHHPCHPHSLICTISQPILCNCMACGKRHEGIFFQCTTCRGFTIHSECVFLPKTLLIQHITDGALYHTHPLTISYSFPWREQEAKHFPRCRACGEHFYDDMHWIYKCEQCIYYAHVDCATSRREPFMSIFLSAGFGKTIKNYKDVDHPRLLHLPFLDETYSVPQQYMFKETGSQTVRVDNKVNLQHSSHQHPLVLVDPTQCNNNNTIGQTSSGPTTIINSWLLSKCHYPMKKIQLLCNGCLRPIMSTMPFYICVDESCNNFALHEWCTRLPPQLENHPGHPQHTLHLIYSNIPHCFFDVFYCDVCDLPCNGFTYCCVECRYYVDVTCGFIPRQITHEAHPNHLLSLVQEGKQTYEPCHMCLTSLRGTREHQLIYNCNLCDVYIEAKCALLLSKTIRHKYDKHTMHLSYLPIENHKSQYFCEICEEDLNPHESFYHCQGCVQSVHAACAPLILQSETHTYVNHSHGNKIYSFTNIKFGGSFNTDSHRHLLSFAQGIGSDGACEICDSRLQYKMIFKCFKCKFAVCYRCLRPRNKRSFAVDRLLKFINMDL